MNDNVDNLILEQLRALRNEVAGLRTDMQQQFSDVKQRLHGIESSVLTTRREALHRDDDAARQQVSIDGLLERIARIERRLELS